MPKASRTTKPKASELSQRAGCLQKSREESEVGSRSAAVLGYGEHRRPKIGHLSRLWKVLGGKKTLEKGEISRVVTPYRWYADTAPLREEKREVKDHLLVRAKFRKKVSPQRKKFEKADKITVLNIRLYKI